MLPGRTIIEVYWNLDALGNHVEKIYSVKIRVSEPTAVRG